MTINRDSADNWLLDDVEATLTEILAAADAQGPQTIVIGGRSYQVIANGVYDGKSAAEFLSQGGPLDRDDIKD